MADIHRTLFRIVLVTLLAGVRFEAASAADRYILTPPSPETPRINSAAVFGVRPGHPFLYTIAATGKRPMQFAVEGLPEGLRLDAATGRIEGKIAAPGEAEYKVALKASNELGQAERVLRVRVGEAICLTPPMGWNSWNCWGPDVDAEKVLASARAMVDKGLVHHGWTYINIDDAWQAAERGGAFSAIQGNERFPDMKKLCDEVHAMGLKVGTYSTPWMTSYAGYIGGSSDDAKGTWQPPADRKAKAATQRMGRYSFAENDARQFAAWGIDYLKYDWKPNSVPETAAMAHALRQSGRDIVLSLSNSAPYEHAAEWARHGQLWRTTLDIRDTWGAHEQHMGIQQIRSLHEKWAAYNGPGHWCDPDMLVVGDVGWNEPPHPSHLTPDEQYTHISLWCLWGAPLLIGCPLERLDDFTLGLLTNDEVLAVDQDPLGRQGYLVQRDGEAYVYAKPLEEGSWAVGLFNFADEPQKVSLKFFKSLNLQGRYHVRDLWRQKDLGAFAAAFATDVPAHGVALVKLTAAP
ncbi:MAG: putative Ig domain-containing protein [Planctomycetota bacterium]